MKRSCSAIIFDLDGTLIDSRQGVQESIEHAVHKVLPDLPMVDFSPFIGPPIKKILTNALGPLNDSHLQEISLEFREVYDSEGCLKCSLFSGVRETLDELTSRRIPIDLATNKPRKATDLVLNHLQLTRYFKGIKAPDPRCGTSTPKKEMVQELMESQFLGMENTIMVGDTMEDWEAARAASIGFAACLYGYGIKEEDLNVDCLILNKIEDLNEYILKQL